MPVQFTCPHCGTQTAVADEYIGQSGPCAQCGKMITIGGPASARMGPPGMEPGGQAGVLPVGTGTACPRCGGRSQRAGPWPWYLGTIGAMIVRAVICNHCGHEFDAKKPAADLGKRKLRLALVINGIGAVGIVVIIGLLALLIWSLQ